MLQLQDYLLSLQLIFLLMNSSNNIEILTEIPTQLTHDDKNSVFSAVITTPYAPQINYSYNKLQTVQRQTNLTIFPAYSNFKRMQNKEVRSSFQKTESSQAQVPNYAVIKTTMCVDLIKRPQFLKYSKSLLLLLIEISRKMSNLPPIMRFNPSQAAIWLNLKVDYPRSVLRYDEIFHSSAESAIYIVTEDYSEYMPMIVFIERARLANKSRTNTAARCQEEGLNQQQDYNNFECLNRTQIIIVMRKIMDALTDLLTLEELVNEQKLQELGFFSQIPGNQYQDEPRYMYLLKYLNPQLDILIHPRTLDVKICNFGLKEDLDVCTYEYKMNLADTNFIYRHPYNTNFWECSTLYKDQRYIQKYIEEGLRREDMTWLCGMLMYRLTTGRFPLKDQNHNIITKICRNDFESISRQLHSISLDGIYGILNQKRGDNLVSLANQMLTGRRRLGELMPNFICNQLQSQFQLLMNSQQIFELPFSGYLMLSLPINSQQILDYPTNDHHQQYYSHKKRKADSPARKQAKYFRACIMNTVKSIKKVIKLKISPLYTAHQQLVSISRDFDGQKNNDLQNKFFLQSTLIGFKMITELRRRCEMVYSDENGENCCGTIVAKLNERINNKQTTKEQKNLLLKLRGKVGNYKENLLRTIKVCNTFILSYCEILTELLREMDGRGPLMKVAAMIQYFKECLYWMKRTTNTEHKIDMMNNIEQNKKKKEIQKVIQQEMKGCEKQVDLLSQSICSDKSFIQMLGAGDKELGEIKKKKLHAQLKQVCRALKFDRFVQQIQPVAFSQISVELEELKSLVQFGQQIPKMEILQKIAERAANGKRNQLQLYLPQHGQIDLQIRNN